MKKIFNIVVLSLAIFIFNIDIGLALDTNGDADIYKVTMRKVELCEGYTVVDFDDVGTDAACKNAVTIGSGDLVVDYPVIKDALKKSEQFFKKKFLSAK